MARRRFTWLLVLALATVLALPCVPRCRWAVYGIIRNDSFYAGYPTSYWRDEILSVSAEPRAQYPAALTHPDPSASAVLFQLVQDAHWPVRLLAVRGLAQGSKTPGLEVLPEGRLDCIPTLIEVLTWDSADVREAAEEVLAKMGPGEATDALPALMRELKRVDGAIYKLGSDGVSKSALVRALSRLGRPAVPGLIEILKQPRTPVGLLAGGDPVRLAAIAALGRMAPEEAEPALPILIESLGFRENSTAPPGHPDDGPRLVTQSSLVVRALASLGDRAIPQLIEVLKTSDSEKLIDALCALGRMGSCAAPALPHVLPLLGNHDGQVYWPAAHVVALLDADAARKAGVNVQTALLEPLDP
jgi:HEAT repeat protein